MAQSVPDTFSACAMLSAVRQRARQHQAVPQPKGDEQSRNAIEHQAPRVTYAAAEHHLQITCNHDEESLSEDCGQSVERAAYAYKPCLLVLVEAEHVETVGGNVVGRAAESHYPKEKQRALKPKVGWYCERNAAECRTD